MSSSLPEEQVFRHFTAEDGKFYAAQRLSYPAALFKLIFEHHASTGGSFGTLLDVGCGPGNSTREIATVFDSALGVDASPGMIASARGLGGETGSGKKIEYEVAKAEEFSVVNGLEKGSVDFLSVATAAHWFDMEGFWKEADVVVKSGGTVALWSRAITHCHPSIPNAAKINSILDRFKEQVLKPYEQPGNGIARNMYDSLIMPWDLPKLISSFPESSFTKHVFDRDGIPSHGEDFFGGGHTISLKQAEKMLSTGSPVVRWREAHPELVGTKDDLVTKLVKELREEIGERNELVVGGGTVILLFKKV